MTLLTCQENRVGRREGEASAGIAAITEASPHAQNPPHREAGSGV